MNPILALLPLVTLTAGDLYINGIQANTLRNQEFKNVQVSIDANGDIHIDTDRYTVSVTDPVDVPAAQAPAAVQTVAPGQYWLITEDNASSGHVVEVRINGALVRTIRSGDPQLIVDLAQYLQIGDNTITIKALPGEYLGGGIMHIYLGPGDNQTGVVHMEHPPIDFARRSSDNPAGTTRTWNLVVE